jgi:hypothetical protein
MLGIGKHHVEFATQLVGTREQFAGVSVGVPQQNRRMPRVIQQYRVAPRENVSTVDGRPFVGKSVLTDPAGITVPDPKPR